MRIYGSKNSNLVYIFLLNAIFGPFWYENVVIKESWLGKIHYRHFSTTDFFEIFWPTSTHLEMSNGNSCFDFLVAFLRGLDPSKKMRDVRTIHFHPFSRRELRHVSENDVFRVWKWRPRSRDTLAKWPTVVRLPSGLAHGRRTPGGTGFEPRPPVPV